MKTKNIISVLLIAFLFAFTIPIIGETPSAIYDGTDSRDTVAPQSADNPATYEWNITWGLSEFQDWGYGVVLDSSDNIYIVGTTENLAHTYDICLLKFDSSGVLQWNRTWGGDDIERGSGIALDSSENIYITGYSEYGPEMYLVKYDSEGILQWNRTRSGQSNAIVIDSSNNIYLTGRIGNGVGLLKYDSQGVEQWVRSWTGGSGANWGNGIVLDSSENIFIVGVASDSLGSYDMGLLKYNSSGGLQWSRTWGYSAADYGESVTIDSFDNIYITGQTTNLVTLQYDIGLVKYSATGVQLWDRIWGGNETDYALAISLDLYGDIFLGGYTWNFGSLMEDFLLVKFDGSGTYQWNLTRGGSGEQRGNAMVLDSSQNIYLVGSTAQYDGFGYVADICLVKYTTTPKITIVSPENKTYTAPDSGYYTASYGFENNKIGEAPSDWQIDGMDGSSYIEVDQHLDGHNYIVEQRKNGGTMRANMVKRFDYNATVGSVEFWFYKDTDSGTDSTRLYILGDTGDGDGRFEYGFTNGDLHYGFWDTRTVVATDILTKDVWHYIQVEFDTSQGVQIRVDGVLYGTGYAYPFLDNPTVINGFKMCSLFSGGNPNYGAWIDAIGFSWDPNYNVGDNLNEGLLLSYDSSVNLEWQGYSLDGGENRTTLGNSTIPMPEDGSHNIKILGNRSQINTLSKNITGSLQGDPTWDSGKIGSYCLDFDGAGDYVDMPSELFTDGFSEYSVSLWFNPDDSSSGTRQMLFESSESWALSLELAVSSNNLKYSIQTDGTYVVEESSITPTEGSWHHAVLVYKENEFTKIYYEGNELTANRGTPSGTLINTDGFHIGTYRSADSRWFDGRIDDVRIFSEAIDDDDVDWLYNSGTGRNTSLIDNDGTFELNWWKFEEGTGTQAYDSFTEINETNYYESDLRYFTINYELPSDITIITPENKTYIQPDAGYYPATYGFENEIPGTYGENTEFLDEYYGSYTHSSYYWIKAVAEYDGHKGVLSLLDAQGGTYISGTHHIDTPQISGTAEFFLRVGGRYASGSSLRRQYLHFRAADNTIGFRTLIEMHDGDILYYDGSSWQEVVTALNETWYHHSVTFNCSAGTKGKFTWIVRTKAGVEVGRVENIDFENSLSTIGELHFETPVSDYGGGCNYDAFGFSWDSDYNVGDNFNEGLLLSYDTTEDLVWKGYSLDGQANVTIFGNHTIPLPANGTHTIQIFGTDSLGTIYQSNLRHFTYGTTTLPEITIISPTSNEFFSNNAPDFQLSIFGASINTTWYTIDGGVTNITFSGLTGTIDQTVWDISANGVINLRFYINNTMGNSSYSEVSIHKDTVAPIVTINSPLESELFGKLPPTFDLSVVELNISSMWYSLDGGSTNITFQELTGTINQNEWDKYGNGTVIITFYAKDEADNEGSAQVTIRKEATPPLITINSPNNNDLFTTSAPSFDITIEEPDLDTTWYTLDDGVTNFTFSGLTGVINQAEWDKFGSGNITLKFYANDSYGFENFAQVTVQKDIGAPIITINSPELGAVFSSIAPSFNITVIDSQLDSMWYTIGNESTNITIVSTVGTIDQIEWDKKGEGSVPLRFYANDTLGNTAYSEVIIIKDTVQPVITVNTPVPYDIFSSVPPSFDLSVVETNLDLVWYTLDNGITNISIISLSGTIDQTEWNKFGNETVTIQFYASDLAGSISFSQVIVLKDIIAPLISIQIPSPADVFGYDAPSFSLSIVESNLNLVWYTLDNGITNFNLGSLVGTIDQAEWNKFGSGNITLKFYANDSVGNEGMSQIIIYKDITAPIITINSPEQDEIISAIAPVFNVTVIDFQLDSLWYTIDNGLTNISIISWYGTIDQIEWNKLGEGSIPIRFYANDTIGNVAYSEIIITKEIFYGIDPVELLTPSTYSHLTSNLLDFSWYSLDAGFGPINFTLQVSNVSDFSYINFQSVDIAETPTITNFSAPLSLVAGQYYWRVRPTYGIYNGNWSDYFSFTLHINNYAPNLVLDGTIPSTGNRFTVFRFTIIYADSDNNAPEYVEILINGISYSMEMVDPLDEDFTDGCIYQYITLLTPSTNAYNISFECSDGAFQYATSTYQGPLVESEVPPDGEQGLEDLNSANTFAITMTLGITIGILIPFIIFTEKKVRKMKLGEKFSTKIKKKKLTPK